MSYWQRLSNLKKMERFECSMCYFRGVSTSHLEKHIIRFHRFDPLFKVKCSYDECGATFKRWKSYKQHKIRRHSQVNQQHQQILEQNNVQMENEERILNLERK